MKGAAQEVWKGVKVCVTGKTVSTLIPRLNCLEDSEETNLETLEKISPLQLCILLVSPVCLFPFLSLVGGLQVETNDSLHP